MHIHRTPIGVIVTLPLLLGIGLYAFTAQGQVEDPVATATPAASESVDASPTSAVFEAPAQTPVLSPTTALPRTNTALHDGAWVRVNAGAGDCLNARNQPSLSSDWVIVNFCLPDGFEGYLSGPATEADGRWWWYMAGAGWVAEEYLAYVRDADLRTNVLPDLADRGRVAFVRDGDIWLMQADGSGQRLLLPLPRTGSQGYLPEELRWSPDASALAFNWQREDPAGGRYVHELHIVRLDGDALAAHEVYDGVAGGLWAPDSRRLGVILDPSVVAMEGIEGTPGIVDLVTGERRPLVNGRVFVQRAPSFNYDGTLVLMAYGRRNADTWESVISITDEFGAERTRIVPPADVYYPAPRWSPVDNRVALHVSRQDSPVYAVYDVEPGRIVAEAGAPKASDKIGGRCGSFDMWRTTWSRDGRRVYYSFSMGDTGANGIWSWDIASGEQVLVPAAGASDASPADGALLYFDAGTPAGSFVFAADAAGGWPRILTDGRAPAWSP